MAGLPVRDLPTIGVPARGLVGRIVGRELLGLMAPSASPWRPRSWLRVGMTRNLARSPTACHEAGH
eukprot:9890028-Lingulodinium_polyedra.AAC.1